MSQYKAGTVSVTNGSQVVIGTGTAWLSNVQAGDGFSIAGSGVPYTVGSVDSDTQITLSANYAGNSGSGLSYAIWRDFTANENLPELFHGDIETATIWTRALRLIDALVGPSSTSKRGTVEKATTAEAEGAVSDKFPDAAGIHAAFKQYGLGSAQVTRPSNADDIRSTGFFRADSGTASSIPVSFSSASILHQEFLGSSSVYRANQIAITNNGDTLFRTRNGSDVWSGWKLLYSYNNILGTVSQSGGVPTGAIFERGSNANGEYVKHADGTLICTSTSVINTTVPAGAEYSSINWTLPVSATRIDAQGLEGQFFPNINGAGTPIYTIGWTYRLSNGSTLLKRFLNTGKSSASSIGGYVTGTTTAESVRFLRFMIGRWF